MRPLRLGTLVAAIFLLAAGVASAGEVLIPKNSPTTAVFRAFNGETNNLTVNGNYVFFDSLALLTAGTGCMAGADGNHARCPQGVLEVYLKDQDDTASVMISGKGSVWAGSGDDTVTADSFSGPTFVYGEGGNDNITAHGEGGQFADGGPGHDVVNAGGTAGQGTGLGGSGNDTIYFTAGFYGPAVLDGGNGDDTIISEPADGTATGGDGDDIIAIHGGIPFNSHRVGFTIGGGAGADTIIATALPDTIDGGEGRDYIDVLDGGADTVSCGPGTDVVRFDVTDTIGADCEILLGPTP